MATTGGFYAAIRKTDGREWIDWMTIGLFPTCSQIAAEQFDRSLLGGKQSLWAKNNPVVRIAKIQLTETESE